jgi:serine phosphatase RsbU (regulator of sigma subunit)
LKAATESVKGPMLTGDPVHASIPEIRDGQLAAVYYGQRQQGDFYDFARVSPERVLIGLFDVAGNLNSTRPIAVSLQSCFRTSGAELLQTSGSNESEAMLELWIQLNRMIMSTAGVHACPAFLACYNEDLKTLTYVNSGHTSGLVRDGQRVQELNATALPLGLFSHSIPDASVVALGEGHALLLISKGIVEARHKGEEFGVAGAKQYLQEISFDSAHETCIGLLSRVRQFMRTAPNHDDVTALSLVRSK